MCSPLQHELSGLIYLERSSLASEKVKACAHPGPPLQHGLSGLGQLGSVEAVGLHEGLDVLYERHGVCYELWDVLAGVREGVQVHHDRLQPVQLVACEVRVGGRLRGGVL